MGDEVCVEQPVGDDICYAPPAQEEQAPIETLDPSVTECDPNQNASGAQDPGPQVTKQPTADDAVDTIRALQNDPQGTSENGAKALDAMNELPTDKKLEAIDQMDRDEVDRFANELPAERRTELKEMAEKCTDPEKKLQLWAKYHAGQAVADADTKNAEGGTDKQAERRTQAANETDSEMSEEVAHLRKKAEDEGRDVTMAEVDELMARKQKEHDLEMKYNINLTNDGDDDIASYKGTAQEKRGRKVWTKDELDLMEPELARLSDDQRAVVKDIRRADVHYKADGTTKDDGVAAHAKPDGEIEVFGDITKTDASGNTSFKQGGVTIHEISHVIDREMPEQDELEKAADFKDFPSKDAMQAKIGDDKMRQLEAAPQVGNYKQQSVTIDGVVYEKVVDAHGTVQYKSYNADALPNPDYTEKTTSGWHDEWDYARTNTDDMFADQFKLAARDPIRSHTDLITGPQREVDDLDAKAEAEKKSGGAITPDTQKRLDEAKKRQETLQEQYEKMRNFNGVNDDTIMAAGDDLDAQQYAAFQDQAQYVQTPGQLAELAKLHKEGKAVDSNAIADKSSSLPSTLSPDDKAAFEEDAKKCFTPAQLDKLAESYKTGKRKGTRDGQSKTLRGTWDTSKISGEDSLLGT